MKNVIMGFEFNNEENFNMAKKELDYTMHIKENLNNLNPEKTLELYNKLIDDKLFKTLIGMEFLRKLQKKLFDDKAIDNSKIKSIPATIYIEETADNSDNSNRRDRKNSGNSNNNNSINNSNISNNKSSKSIKSSNNKKNIVSKENKKNNTGANSSGNKSKNNKYKDLYIKMLIINLALVITIVVMFVITKRADKFDEDYYRESIENEYVSWQKALEEKESSIAAEENAS